MADFVQSGSRLIAVFLAIVFLIPESACATQMHSASEGVIVHQIGHLFFLISMVILYLTIQGKSLHLEKGWRFIQLSAFLFVLWNLDALLVHFFDNQIHIISPEVLSILDIRIDAMNNSKALAWAYYFLRLDHLFSFPAMILFWRGLTLIIRQDIIAKGQQEDIVMKDKVNINDIDQLYTITKKHDETFVKENIDISFKEPNS